MLRKGYLGFMRGSACCTVSFVVAVVVGLSSLATAQPSLDWARFTKGQSSQTLHGVATDNAGNVYTVGGFDGRTSFGGGGGQIFVEPYANVFIQKCNSNGAAIWVRDIHSDSSLKIKGVAVDAFGNTYVTGYFHGTCDFDPGEGTAEYTTPVLSFEVYVLKLNSAGEFEWARIVESSGSIPGSTFANDLALDGSGNVFVVGIFSADVDLDPGPGVDLHSSAGNNDGFLVKLDSSGNYQWGTVIGGPSADGEISVAIEPNGNVVTFGGFQGDLDFDPGPGTSILSSDGNSDGFVRKLDTNGNLIWAKLIRSTHLLGRSVAVDRAGNVYAAGFVAGGYPADFDPGPGTFILTGPDDPDRSIFTFKLDASGNFAWAHLIEGALLSSQLHTMGIAVDRLGNVYYTASFYETADLDPGPGTYEFSSDGDRDAFVQKLDTAGKMEWTYVVTGPGVSEANAITFDRTSNEIIVGGQFRGWAKFADGPLLVEELSAGVEDAFTLKLSQPFSLPPLPPGVPVGNDGWLIVGAILMAVVGVGFLLRQRMRCHSAKSDV